MESMEMWLVKHGGDIGTFVLSLATVVSKTD